MMKHIQRMFPSEDGNREARYELLGLFETVLAGMDKRKDPKRLILGKEEHVSADYYQRIINQAALPEKGLGAKKALNSC